MLVALTAATVAHTGDTLSGIAASHSTSLAAVEADNPQISNPDLIYPGETIYIGKHRAGKHRMTFNTSSPSSFHAVYGTSGVATTAFERCVITRESGGNPQVMNASGHYGLYQFDLATWESGGGSPATFGHASPSEQRRVFLNVFAARGVNPWRPYDGC